MRGITDLLRRVNCKFCKKFAVSLRALLTLHLCLPNDFAKFCDFWQFSRFQQNLQFCQGPSCKLHDFCNFHDFRKFCNISSFAKDPALTSFIFIYQFVQNFAIFKFCKICSFVEDPHSTSFIFLNQFLQLSPLKNFGIFHNVFISGHTCISAQPIA